jgi:hypothetical protein
MLVVDLFTYSLHFISLLMATCLLSPGGFLVSIHSCFCKFWHNGCV